MGITILALWILVMSIGTNGFTQTINYKSVFVPKKHVSWQGNTNVAKSSVQCANFYQRRPDSRLGLFRFEQGDEDCLIGEAKYNGTVMRMKTRPDAIQVMGSPQFLFGEQLNLTFWLNTNVIWYELIKGSTQIFYPSPWESGLSWPIGHIPWHLESADCSCFFITLLV